MSTDSRDATKQTLIEEGTKLRGSLESTCRVVVKGVIDGELSAPDLSVASSGAVEGAIKARKIHSEGRLSGRVDAGEVYLSGSVGDSTVINAETLEVKLGSGGKPLQVSFGNCNLQVGDDPVAALADGSKVAAASSSASSSSSSSSSAAASPAASAAPPSSPSNTPPPSRRAGKGEGSEVPPAKGKSGASSVVR